MQKKYPENIADIENFYQNSLGAIKIEPSADMWDRIEASLDKNKKPKGFFFSFSTKKIYSALAVVLIAGVSCYFIFTNQNNSPVEQKNTPVILKDTSSFSSEEKFIENIEEETNPQEELPENKKADKAVEKKNPSGLSNSEKLNTNESHEQVVVTDTTPAKTSITTSEPVKEEKVKEEPAKEKVSFKEKYKKKYQDSTRPLFVPTH